MVGAPKSSWRSTVPLAIGAWSVDPAANELSRDGVPARVRPLLMDVLLRLAAAPGEVVSRDQLLADVWPRRMVNDEVLSRAIAELRTALGDEAKQPQYVETLPKIGYRLIAPVRRLASAAIQDAQPVARQPDARSGAKDPPPVRNDDADAVRRAGVATPERADGAAAQRRERTGAGPGWFRRPGSRASAIAALAIVLGAAGYFGWTAFGGTAHLERLATQLGQAESFAAEADGEFGPRFAPDGRSVVYAQARGRESVLVLRDITGRVTARIEKPGTLMMGPVFLPDGKRIVFWQRSADGCAIVERELESGTERRILGCDGAPRTVSDVSPDGRWLAVSVRARAQHPYGIARVALADGKLEMLTAPQPGEGDDARPRFSPDGARIVFSRGNNSHGKLWLLEVEKPAAARPLGVPEGLDYGVAWLGKGGPLLASADWAGFRALVRVDLQGDGVTGVDVAGARGARFPDVNRDGDIVFEDARYRADLWLTDADHPGATTEALWPSTRYTNQPAFSPDGTQVVFVSNREGAESLYVAAFGASPRRLTLSSDFRFIRPHWSADGKALYAVRSPVSARRSGPSHGVRLDLATNAVEVLSGLGENVADVLPLRGSALLVAERSGNAFKLSRFMDGRYDRLPLPLVTEFQVDGDDLVYMQPDLAVVTRCKLSSMQCAPLPVKIADADRYHWHLARGVLWHRTSEANGAKLMRLDLESGEARAFDFAPTGSGTGLAASPDGRKLIVTREAPTVVDLMLARKNARR